MTINANPIATKTADLIAPISNYSLYLCHEASGETVLVDSAPVAQQLFGDITLGSATGSFDSIDYTPDGTQEQRKIDAASVANYNLKGYQGQFIIAFDVYGTANPSATEVIARLGRTIAGEGRISVDFLTGGRASIAHVSSIDGSDTATKNSLSTLCGDSTRHSVFCYIDTVSLVINMYVDGIGQGADQPIASADSLVIGLPTTDRGFVPFANATSSSAYSLFLGLTSTGLKINRLLFMKTTSDQSDNLASIAAGLSNIAHELPWELDGV